MKHLKTYEGFSIRKWFGGKSKEEDTNSIDRLLKHKTELTSKKDTTDVPEIEGISLEDYCTQEYPDTLKGIKVYNTYSKKYGYIGNDEVSADDIQEGWYDKIWVSDIEYEEMSSSGSYHRIHNLIVVE